ncbi:MAG TPA: aliphatic sulfonate ABC transporter substrate-binding protein [Oculatellaceae cyanobacterium]
MPKRLSLALCLFALTFSTKSFAAELKNVHMGSFSKAVDYAPYLVAKRKGLFEQALKPLGATAAYDEFQSLPTINEAFATKRLDAVVEAEAPCIVGRAAGIDLKILGVSALVDVPVVVNTKSGINSIAALKGKKVAVLAGTSAHYILCKLLEGAGLGKNDIHIVDMTPPDAKAAFETNKIDAWAIWSPFVEQEELSGQGKALQGASGLVDVVMVARSEFVKDNPKIAKALTDTLNSTRSWVAAHPKESQRIVAEELKLPLPVVEKAWARQDWKSGIDDKLRNDIQKKADFLKSAGLVRKPVDAKGLF